MRVLVYLGFTLLSILIQFCVMDFIQDQLEETEILNLDIVNSEEKGGTKNIHNNNQLRKLKKTNMELKKTIFNNTSRFILPPSTTMTSTILDIFYDENITTTDFNFTTDLFTNTEVDNVTEINFPVNIQPVTPKPDVKPKSIKECNCNLLYEVCDINCCCDNDCSLEEQNLFNCKNFVHLPVKQDNVCQAYLFPNNDRYRNNLFDNIFCIVKINLPEKRKIHYKKISISHQYLKWRNNNNLRIEKTFNKELFKSGDPLWLIDNETISQIDLPWVFINNYCYKRKPVVFLKDEEIKCLVKIKDLEMFRILSLVEQTKIISATNISMNSSSLNCSTLHCANWTVLVCDDFTCKYYNKSSHRALCTENICTNIALTVDYTFYIRQTKIVNATVKLHVQNISTILPYVSQKIRVNFLLTNTSIEEIVKYSGNPGYKKGLRVIISRAKGNYTEIFHKTRSEYDKYFTLPEIRNGRCFSKRTSDNFIVFGVNKRLKCRLTLENYDIKTNNQVCKDVKDNIQLLFFANDTTAVSAYGKPKRNDDEWIEFNFHNSHQESMYSRVDNKAHQILCYNLITKISLSFTFIRLNEEGNKILSVEHQVVMSNKSFAIENNTSIAIAVGIDVSFIDVSKPAVFEYASNPHLDINLPKDFFFPSNKSHFQCSNVYYVIILYCHIFIFK